MDVLFIIKPGWQTLLSRPRASPIAGKIDWILSSARYTRTIELYSKRVRMQCREMKCSFPGEIST
jgi:hypothetical protein